MRHVSFVHYNYKFHNFSFGPVNYKENKAKIKIRKYLSFKNKKFYLNDLIGAKI